MDSQCYLSTWYYPSGAGNIQLNFKGSENDGDIWTIQMRFRWSLLFFPKLFNGMSHELLFHSHQSNGIVTCISYSTIIPAMSLMSQFNKWTNISVAFIFSNYLESSIILCCGNFQSRFLRIEVWYHWLLSCSSCAKILSCKCYYVPSELPAHFECNF